MAAVHLAFRACLVLACLALAPLRAAAQDDEVFEASARNLLVVLRESHGQNKQDESLKPFGTLHATLPNGQEIALDTSWYQYLGDMHIRLVFDGVQSLQSATPADLSRLKLSPDEALQLAVSNLRRRYGSPEIHPWSGGVMQVQGTAPDLTSSYFLDRDFWQQMEHRYPGGLVVAVPRRGGLVYAPAADESAVESLRFGVAALYAGGAGARLSSGLYLFKEGHWSVFQPPQSP